MLYETANLIVRADEFTDGYAGPRTTYGYAIITQPDDCEGEPGYLAIVVKADWCAGQPCWVATIPELLECRAQGATVDAALKALGGVLALYLDAMPETP